MIYLGDPGRASSLVSWEERVNTQKEIPQVDSKRYLILALF